MKQRLVVALIVSTLALLGSVQYAFGAAVMSIDLGSEWMKVGIVSPGVPMEIALNKESKRKTPVILSFRDGQRLFGEDAATVGLRFPTKSFHYLLDLLGKTVDNPIVKLYQTRFPYYNIEADPERNTVVFKIDDDTKYSVEELIAQILQKARDFAESSTGQPITECVITTPGFFGQAERTALLTAANLANIKVLQLLNDYTAVALNYGIFSRKEINDKAQYFVFYDMGAYHTTASVVSYQLVKDKATRETNPVVQVIGVGYDRTLGGLEMQLRLRDYLGKEFNKMKKTKTDVFTNPRALAKLFKEAGRVKNVLSANTDHFAQIEGLLDEQDFRLQVTREKFEELCKDLFERAVGPLDQALKNSGLNLSVINQVTLFGGSSRVPKVQEALKTFVGKELGKNINTDEAAALGAVYNAADLATGFRVSKFIVKEAVLFPIQVTFEREGNSGNTKVVKRSLFTAFGSYPQKKVITFNKNTEDFAFEVSYAELDHLPSNEVTNIGSLNLLKIKLNDVNSIISAHAGENIEPKGIKAHFVLDDSGLFSLSGIEFVADKNVTEQEEENAFAKLGNTITKLFTSNDEEKKEPDTEEKTPEEGEKAAEDGKKPTEGEAAANATATNETDSTASTEKKPISKIVSIKEPIPYHVDFLYAVHLKGDKYEEARKKVDRLNELERQIVRRESALNALESFVIEANQRLNEEEYASCATSKEIEELRKACADVSDWIYEDGQNADADTYEKKLVELQAISNPIYARHWEHRERSDVVNTFNKMIAHAKTFLTNAKNMTKESNSDKDIFTQVEIETLEKAINDAEQWVASELEAQNKLKRSDAVQMTVKSITDRMALLDREVKYLINKLKIWKPKVKETPKKSKKAANDSETTESETVGAEATVEEPKTVNVEQDVPAAADDQKIDDADKTDEHVEL
ncbi:hypoxia up-regulated protein 1 [Sitodiplosis mosellana]|uniref:hypoxia up-regulated protein 1 n=1 Tax=Sitodiplosis mosellana TaxID=263140 RepID=UPI002444F864|nr:hypoxia up-regulated protein 1 [Sitodiplosis mosellana]XP_055321567.1 hypoxia up-regulated protein 1 [Sitodiplosis mosellana]XP_055321576.1 hypoxia up-regulated protein 1 [Sitodiplosis mosellana]XP_055321586.1 hypoxia up-regulated protein 1 [Sitodiplosis mosellana]